MYNKLVLSILSSCYRFCVCVCVCARARARARTHTLL